MLAKDKTGKRIDNTLVTNKSNNYFLTFIVVLARPPFVTVVIPLGRVVMVTAMTMTIAITTTVCKCSVLTSI